MDRKRHPKPTGFEPEPFFAADHPFAGQRRCQAWNFNHGRQCGKKARQGKSVCEFHGGKSLSGAASATYKTGIYSKAVTERRWAEAYHEGLDDYRILSMQDDIALNYARISEALEKMDTAATADALRDLNDLMEALEGAVRSADANAVVRATQQIRRRIKTAQSGLEAQENLDGLIEQRRKMLETEFRNRERTSQMMAVSTAVEIMVAWANEIKRHVISNTTQTEARKLLAGFAEISDRYLPSSD